MNETKALKGFVLALIATMMWGALPLAVQQVLPVMSATTIVWYRFIAAALGLFLILAYTKKLPRLKNVTFRQGIFLTIGTLALAANFVFFSTALNYVSATTTQVVSQATPFLLILASVPVFKEQLKINQIVGLGILILGLLIFFHNQFGEILQFGDFAGGILLIFSASSVWVMYAICQKLLLDSFNPQQVLVIVYIGCSIVLMPTADMPQLFNLNSLTIGFFLFACVNTLIGYGAYAEALKHLEASRVSAVTVLVPVFTIIFSSLGHFEFPDIFDDPRMDFLNYLGATIVVFGTILSVAGHKLMKIKEI